MVGCEAWFRSTAPGETESMASLLRGAVDPASHRYLDLCQIQEYVLAGGRRISLDEALKVMKLERAGTAHRALGDAIDTARLFLAWRERFGLGALPREHFD